MLTSATPSIEEILELIDSGVLEFKNQKLCDSDKVLDVLLDIRNLVSSTSEEHQFN
jgi:hypothetical protein